MKTFTAALSVLFVVVFCYQASSSPSESNLSSPRSCLLFLFAVVSLSSLVFLSFVSSHWISFSIFTTIKDKLVCANPNDKWVKDIMNQLKDNKHSG
ncbi:CCL4 protein, partial [Calcarius ornatus]|nr:CCL4 protein [Calcarius ornatus]